MGHSQHRHVQSAAARAPRRHRGPPRGPDRGARQSVRVLPASKSETQTLMTSVGIVGSDAYDTWWFVIMALIRSV